MLQGGSAPRSTGGFSLLELITAFSLIGVVIGSVLVATLGTQSFFVENQNLSQLQLMAQNAMDRVVELSSQALTADSVFSPLKPSTGVGSHCLRFRLIQSIDPATGDPIYDDSAVVYIYGPDGGASPSSGLILGRGPTLADIHTFGQGADGLLGTSDDDTTTSLAGGLPAVELLVPSNFAPQAGEMFTVDVSPAPVGRLLTFTLRVNRLNPDGTYLLPADLVLSERVALRA